MSDTADTKRLAEAVANLATTITEIIELKIRESWEAARVAETKRAGSEGLHVMENWVGRAAVAEHLKISRRTMYNWMRRGLIPHVRLGSQAKFKLSQVDEAMNRRSKGPDRY